MIATRSPTLMPAATKPLAVARTSASTSRAVTGDQPSPSGRDMITRSGSNHARCAMSSVRFPSVAAGTIGATAYSVMGKR